MVTIGRRGVDLRGPATYMCQSHRWSQLVTLVSRGHRSSVRIQMMSSRRSALRRSTSLTSSICQLVEVDAERSRKMSGATNSVEIWTVSSDCASAS